MFHTFAFRRCIPDPGLARFAPDPRLFYLLGPTMVLILSCGCSRARGTLPFALTIPYDGVVCNFSASLRSVTSNSFDRCFAIYFAELPCSLVFFPKCGRYSSEARALKLDKQSKAAKQGRKNESSPYKNEPTVANKQQQTEQRQARRSANPPARFAYRLTKKENNSNMGPEPNAETTPIATIAFFSSGMADHALRLGSYMRRSNY